MKINSEFLTTPVETWQQNENFIKTKAEIRALSVVNDSAERGVSLAKDFQLTLTKDETQQQYLLHHVFDNRKLLPNEHKCTIIRSASEL